MKVIVVCSRLNSYTDSPARLSRSFPRLCGAQVRNGDPKFRVIMQVYMTRCVELYLCLTNDREAVRQWSSQSLTPERMFPRVICPAAGKIVTVLGCKINK